MQHRYQALDEGFVGVIVSCFNSGAPLVSSMQTQVIAFQSVFAKELVMDAADDEDLEDMDSATRHAILESTRG
jgi:hypothetical protein